MTAYPAPGAAAPPPRRNRTGCVIAAIVGVLLLVCLIGCGALFVVPFAATGAALSQPVETTKSFYDALKAGDYTRARTYLSSQSQTTYPPDLWQATWQQIETERGKLTDYAIPMIFNIPSSSPQYSNVNGRETASFGVEATWAKSGKIAEKVDLLKENGAWKINFTNP